MSLKERFFPIMRQNSNHFEDLMKSMKAEMHDFDSQIDRMRGQMLQLVPFEDMDTDRNLGMVEMKMPIVESQIPGQGKLKLEFDVKQFKPEEVEVKVMGNNVLQVNALHEEKSDSGYSRRQYCRQYHLPEGVQADKINSVLTQDGVLTIEAPAPAPGPKEKKIPIEYKK